MLSESQRGLKFFCLCDGFLYCNFMLIIDHAHWYNVSVITSTGRKYICLINWLKWATESEWTEKGNVGAVFWWQLWQWVRRKLSWTGFIKPFSQWVCVCVCAVGRHLSVNIDHYWPDTNSCLCCRPLISLVHFIMQSLFLHHVLPLILLCSLCPSEIPKANVWMSSCQPARIRTWEPLVVFTVRLTQSHSL